MDGFDFYVGTTGKHHDNPPKFYSSDDLLESWCRFASLYAVTEETGRCVSQAGTTAGYRGIVWNPRLWVDCDTKESTRWTISRLKELGYAFDVWDTGGERGCHVSVLRDSRPSHLLPIQDKGWVVATFVGVDTSIYSHLHLFRLPGAIHELTGRPKRLVEHHTGKTLILPKWQQAEPKSVSGISTGEAPKGIFRSWDVISNLTPNGGSRHDQLLKLAVAVRRAGGGQQEAIYLCRELNKLFNESKSDLEVISVAEWVYSQENLS